MSRRTFVKNICAIGAAKLFPLSVANADGSGSITVKDSPLQNALDVYYDNLTRLCQAQGFGGTQKLLLCNTITPFAISDDTPYYSQGLFRNYADRVFSGDPQNTVGPANRADRFSYAYLDLIYIANSQVERSHPEIAPALHALTSQLEEDSKALTDFKAHILTLWNQRPESSLPITDPKYILGYETFLNDLSYESQLAVYKGPITNDLSQIDALKRRVYKPWEQALLDNYNALSPDVFESRPLQPTFERSWAAGNKPRLTDLDFASDLFRVPALFDVSPAIFPLTDLQAFLSQTSQRTISITSSSTYSYTHDSQWGAGGSASYKFFNFGGSGSGSSHFETDMQKAVALTLTFQNIQEFLADREDWFNPSVLLDPNVTKLLANIPEYQKLQYVSVSVIVGRGLTLQVSFNTAVDSSSWSRSAIDGSGGISIFGVNIGGHAGSSSSETTVSTSADGKTVTFQDGPTVCRVLGYRIEPFIPAQPMRAVHGRSTKNRDAEAMKQFLTGKISYQQLQKTKIQK